MSLKKYISFQREVLKQALMRLKMKHDLSRRNGSHDCIGKHKVKKMNAASTDILPSNLIFPP